MGEYKQTGPIDCNVQVDTTKVKGKTAIVTGGAGGIGEAYVRGLVGAGAIVAVGDFDSKRGEALASELSGVKFVKCDVTKWDDQTRLFREAVAFSSTGKVSYVVANAGISRQDQVFARPEPDQEPAEPDLKTMEVNIKGTLYTTKLAMHYFMRQNGTHPSSEQEDTCLVLIGSGAAFLDCPRTPQYQSTKWAVRGIMHALRRTTHYYGSRVNIISPWYIRTNILPDKTWDQVASVGVQFATLEDAGRCLLRILADPGVNGHSFFLAPRRWAPSGFMDFDLEDYMDPLLQEIQEMQMASAPPSMGLFSDEIQRSD
jgi:NAD(P)-dependent dehydrogenase (short-subunit alcohol dehydrogenase family)